MKFLEYIYNNSVTLLDGAMGTELKKRDIMGDFENNINHKDIVKEVHKSYIKAGSKAIITNTFSLNRLYLNKSSKKIDLEKINKEGVKIAKEVAQNDVFVLGDISSTGKLLKPYGEYDKSEFIKVFEEKATYLKESGVDAFIIETMVDLKEAISGLKACKNVSDLPVIVSISFDTLKDGGRTVMGNSVYQTIELLNQEKADIIGANCGSLSPLQLSEIVKVFKDNIDLPIMVKPNAGLPKLQGDQTIYDMGLEEFTEGIMACIDQGASLVGGCCGTTPEHIDFLNKRINNKYYNKEE
ncbi:MAG: homocysteine S-methyltransferase family protein [Halanaerobiales bacterium]|nr:homocysteine S-methyltransferase family protein [Halanaerobiales bacterium]